MEPVDLQLLKPLLLAALQEDVGSGDITSRAVIPATARARARFTTKQDLVAAGIPIGGEIVHLVDRKLEFIPLVAEGTSVPPKTPIAEIRGSARSILTAERTSLNLLQRMCGIATLTRKFVDQVQGTKARIVDTRKTAPGMRILDKYAVSCGGGMNHRMGLFDGVLIKNNHVAFHTFVDAAIRAARLHLGHLVKVEVEVRSIEELKTAIASGADVILLDNFDPELTREAVKLVDGRIPIESSGGITLETVREFAEAGVDYISIGALTHSVPAVDIHLKVMPE
jgi:nicotinate-nucleotide pyrophosphorylase (carboxylating)